MKIEVVKDGQECFSVWRDGVQIGTIRPLFNRWRGLHGLECEDAGGIFATKNDAIVYVVAKELWFDAQWENRVEVAA